MELDFGDHERIADFASVRNVPTSIASAVLMEQPRVSLHELQTVYSLRDLYDLLEVGAVRAHNERVIAVRRAEQDRKEREQRGL